MSSHCSSVNRKHFKRGVGGWNFCEQRLYSFIIIPKVHLHMTKYFLLVREEFQDINVSGKKESKEENILKSQSLTYLKTFEAMWHLKKTRHKLDFPGMGSYAQSTRLLHLPYSLCSPTTCNNLCFLHKGRSEGLVPNCIFMKHSLQKGSGHSINSRTWEVYSVFFPEEWLKSTYLEKLSLLKTTTENPEIDSACFISFIWADWKTYNYMNQKFK